MVRTIRIDQEHVEKLMEGESIAFLVPEGTTVLKLTAKSRTETSVFGELAHLADVFFNGRKA